ncbi:NlpC/P60 family protein [Nonomuraea sp. MCN248]|uniref:NlpC/P60 family protein n=1 Tax=Nonomuraea corallina TaxID=2989783 RepID=A0ABT4S4K0_9ACTN|nr:NlpC/P60 family protein [Nonomuraea corallina]MDA0631983.1 NlpC/P60 family protein [Nonomuraea corallina]
MKPRIRLMGLALAGGLVSVPAPAHAAAPCPTPGSGFFDPTFLCRLLEEAELPEPPELPEAAELPEPAGLPELPEPAEVIGWPGAGLLPGPRARPDMGGVEAAPAAGPGAATRSKRRTRGGIAATAALARIGTPFSWGGGSRSGPTRGVGRGAGTVGFDCSGLTMYAWGRAGVRLGHYTGTQFRQGRRVPLSRLRTGDLLFFGGGAGDPTHVGLYLRAGRMVHAPKTGDVVKVAQFLRSPHFRSAYRGAVRPG